MKNFRFNYIITIHNKQDLIAQVLEGLLACKRENSFIYPVLDGCTDNTEKVIDEIIEKNPQASIIKVYTPDVHELLSINAGLKAADQSQIGCNIILQDDVIIKEKDFESLVYKVYEHFGYENIGYLSFRHGVNMYMKDRPEFSEIFRQRSEILEERDIIESAYGTGMSPLPLKPHMLVERMVSVGSPQCLSCHVVNTIGMMDEKMAPVSYSCHDISLRCLEAGKKNLIFAVNFESEVEWGGTRTNPNPKHAQIMVRNQHYLYKKYSNFLEKFRKSKEYFRLKQAKPFFIPEIVTDIQETKNVVSEYYVRRKRGMTSITHWISKFIKLPLKWALIRLGLY
jgi:glycosyltransferase involved in cell wall biosynthesis